MLAIFSKFEPKYPPDKIVDFCNSNFVILGYILEKIYSKPYKELFKEKITIPIGLNDTYLGSKTNIANNECYSYRFCTNWIKESETDMSIPGGAGAIVSTPTDLTRFIEALFSYKLVKKSTLNTMTTLANGFGMGIFQYTFCQNIAFGYNGGIDGFGAVLRYFPNDNIAVSYCTNGQNYPLNDILTGILNICFNKPYSIPTFKTFKLTDEESNPYLGTYSSYQLFQKITISKKGTTLIASASGQPEFPLEATEKNKFKFDLADIKMEFNPDKNELILYQNGGIYYFTKEN